MVVIWNLTNRCNLSCPHCYTHATSKKLSNELDTRQCKNVIDDLAMQNVMVLILSGGEPVLRPDLYELAAYARDKGISCALSTNGTLINNLHVGKILKSGIGYVGISIDSIGQNHDKFRGKQGAYAASLNAIRLCRDAGLKVGLRLSLTAHTVRDLPEIFELFEKEKLVKLYISHLNYSDLSSGSFALDTDQIRESMRFVIKKALTYINDGNVFRDIVTGNNEADGPFLYLLMHQENSRKAKLIYERLAMAGGNSSGIRLANIDPLGDVHPDPFCRDISLGNVRQKPFSQIWQTSDHPFVVSLRDRKTSFHGRCGNCRFIDLCGGNSRARAFAHTVDWWGSDPMCYLTSEEISQK
jgi:radical SAM protein with 4Fe4S-binding SPASM domain